jgi:two-component system response regulator GlrR
MHYKGGEFCDTAEKKSKPESVEVLTVCASGADELARALQAELQSAGDLEMSRLDLPAADSGAGFKILAERLGKFPPNLLALCVTAGAIDGAQDVFYSLRQLQCETPILVILEASAMDQLQRLIRLGAADFCVAPLRLEDILPRILRWARPLSRASRMVPDLAKTLGLQQFLGKSRIFIDAITSIPKLARCEASVFITGETGTGKEMCARAIHHLGPRANHPFIPVNCGAIPSELVENELFGHEAGAFTSASAAVRGLVQDAEGGTLFLDEIDSLPLQIQVKFLRFLQDQGFRPLGARKQLQADVRIIAASNADIEAAIRSQKFRPDLFYRLNVLPLKLPSLRERPEDIPLLARHFVTKSAKQGPSTKELSPGAIDKLFSYRWPGNVRELENVIARAVILSDGPIITREDICLPSALESVEEMSFKALKQHAIAEFESGYIRQLLASSEGNISQAARAAKKNRRAFWQLMRKYDIAASTYLERPRTNLCQTQDNSVIG